MQAAGGEHRRPAAAAPAPPFVVLMLRPTAAATGVCGWSKYKWLALALLAFIALQFVTGRSIYSFSFNDVRLYASWSDVRRHDDGAQAAVTQATAQPQPAVAAGELGDYRLGDIRKTTVEPPPAAAGPKQAANFTLAPLPAAGSNRSSPASATAAAPVPVRPAVTNASTSTSTAAVASSAAVPAAADNSSSSNAVGEYVKYENETFAGQPDGLEQCPAQPPVLVGPIRVWFDYPTFDELRRLYPSLERGGHGKPAQCVSRHRVAIIIPYRDRPAHLRTFLHNLHSLLAKQQLDYAIFVVEQIAEQTFNRGKLMNVGFAEANKLYDWQCYIFHDVDLLPQDDRNIYSCPEQPRHMSVGVDKFNYKLPYTTIFGGITAMTRRQFASMNGYPNDYWGWGGEDDDMSTRVTMSGHKISRYPPPIARYKMIKHKQESANPTNACRFKLMAKTKSRWRLDGLSNLDYEALSVDLMPTHTRVLVDLLEANSKRQLVKNTGLSKC